jgi:hypothetical protein
MTDRPGISKRDAKVQAFIEAFIRKEGFGPSYREISRGAGIKLGSVHISVQRLLRRNYLIADTDPLGHVARGSLAIVRGPDQASVTVLVTPAGKFVETECTGSVTVAVRTVFPKLERANG